MYISVRGKYVESTFIKSAVKVLTGLKALFVPGLRQVLYNRGGPGLSHGPRPQLESPALRQMSR
jgi:hypothetical protein